MSECECGNEIVEPDLANSMVTAAGWCTPTEVVYQFPMVPLCSDCRSRIMFISEIGFDPGKDGENLRVPRGGIKYPGALT